MAPKTKRKLRRIASTSSPKVSMNALCVAVLEEWVSKHEGVAK